MPECDICGRDVEKYDLDYIDLATQGVAVSGDQLDMDEQYSTKRTYCASCFDVNVELPVAR